MNEYTKMMYDVYVMNQTMQTTSASGPQIRSPQRLYLLASYARPCLFVLCVCVFAALQRSFSSLGCEAIVFEEIGEKEEEEKEEEEKEKKVFVHGLWSSPKAAMVCLGWNNLPKRCQNRPKKGTAQAFTQSSCLSVRVLVFKKSVSQSIINSSFRIPNCGSSSN